MQPMVSVSLFLFAIWTADYRVSISFSMLTDVRDIIVKEQGQVLSL